MFVKYFSLFVILLSFLTTVRSDHPLEEDGTSLKLRFKLFQSIPTNEADAIHDGFVKQTECDANSNFRGRQFMKNNDPQVILLFDVNGKIAGLQSGIPNNLTNNYPPVNVRPPFIEDGDLFKLTAYFVNPAIICGRGRSEQGIRLRGVAEYLYIQDGPDPEKNLIEMSLEESKTSWVKGKCFPGMGFHYFQTLRLDMDCDDFFPVALLYYHGELKGFVWSYGAILDSNTTLVPYEYPEPDFFEQLMLEVPSCFATLKRSTLHVYFEKDPTSLDCENPDKPTVCSSTASMGAFIGYFTLMIAICITFWY